MGLTFAHMDFFDLINELFPLTGKNFASLGSQEIHEDSETINNYAIKNGYYQLQKTHKVCDLFYERYKLATYVDIDMNDMADIKLDLAMAAPPSFYEKFDVIFNGGTAEHIFNIGMVFKNMHDMLKTGGIIINIVPYTWFMHGFYNIDPKLLYYIDKSNNYFALAQAFYFQGTANHNGALKLYKIKGNDTPKTDALRNWLKTSSRDTNILYMHVSCKNSSAPFNEPYEIYA